MELHMIVNKDIYLSYKEDVLVMSPRLFCEPYFYNLKEYQEPIDLTGMLPFLSFCEVIHLYATSSFLDFINLLLVLDYVKKVNYEHSICIHYLLLPRGNKTFKEATYATSSLKKQDYESISCIVKSMKEEKIVIDRISQVLGFDSYIEFYNQCLDISRFFAFNEDIFEMDDEQEKLDYLMNKYSQFHLQKEYYLDLLKKMNEG